MSATIGINDLAKDTGEKPRALMHWADLGIIRPLPETDKRGRGRYREFRAEPFQGERKWALIASALAQLRVPLGDVRTLMMLLRASQWGDPKDSSDETRMERFKSSPFYDAMTGVDGPVLLLMSLDERSRHDPYSEVFRFVRSSSPNALQRITEFLRDHPHAFAINLTETFAPLRG
jgi:DNA-binding transcriptional MerR regulator